MNTPEKPDYGEPWSEQTATMNKGVHWLNTEQFNRAVTCVNACAGMADPAAEIKALREAIKEAHEALDGCREDTCELIAERDWWKDEPRCGYAVQYQKMLSRLAAAEASLAKLQPFIKP